jgi:hypothetical protein
MNALASGGISYFSLLVAPTRKNHVFAFKLIFQIIFYFYVRFTFYFSHSLFAVAFRKIKAISIVALFAVILFSLFEATIERGDLLFQHKHTV